MRRHWSLRPHPVHPRLPRSAFASASGKTAYPWTLFLLKDGWICLCSRKWSLWLWRTDLLQCGEYFFEGSSIELVLAAIDVANDSCSIHDERRRMRDPDRIVPKCVIKAVCLGCCAVLIKKKRKWCRMPGQELQRLPNAAAFLGGDIDQTCAEPFDL